MKLRASLLACSLLGLVPAAATVTINGEFGRLRDNSGVVISSTVTLWAIIYDADGNSSLPGGLGINDSLVAADAPTAYTAFHGLTITNGLTIGGDRVIAVGNFNDVDGVATPGLANVDLAGSGLESGRSFGFYWFPGRTLASNQLPNAAFQVGAINEQVNYVGTGANFIGTKIPDDGKNVTTSVLDTNLGGSLGQPRFTAIVVPEPSAALLAGLAALLGLRRRRD